jgi:hypothetical protein
MRRKRSKRLKDKKKEVIVVSDDTDEGDEGVSEELERSTPVEAIETDEGEQDELGDGDEDEANEGDEEVQDEGDEEEQEEADEEEQEEADEEQAEGDEEEQEEDDEEQEEADEGCMSGPESDDPPEEAQSEAGSENEQSFATTDHGQSDKDVESCKEDKKSAFDRFVQYIDNQDLKELTKIQRRIEAVLEKKGPRKSTAVRYTNIVPKQNTTALAPWLQVKDGVLHMNFITHLSGAPRRFSLNVDLQQVDTRTLSTSFRRGNAVYVQHSNVVDFSEVNRMGVNHETLAVTMFQIDCNLVGWKLARLNATLQRAPGVIQIAVDHYRTLFPLSDVHLVSDLSRMHLTGVKKLSPDDMEVCWQGPFSLHLTIMSKHKTKSIIFCQFKSFSELGPFDKQFKKKFAVFPRALKKRIPDNISYSPQRRKYEKEMNLLGWRLAAACPKLQRHRYRIQLAVDTFCRRYHLRPSRNNNTRARFQAFDQRHLRQTYIMSTSQRITNGLENELLPTSLLLQPAKKNQTSCSSSREESSEDENSQSENHSDTENETEPPESCPNDSPNEQESENGLTPKPGSNKKRHLDVESSPASPSEEPPTPRRKKKKRKKKAPHSETNE